MQHYKSYLFLNRNGRNSYHLPMSLLLTIISTTALQAQDSDPQFGATLASEKSLAITRPVLLGYQPGNMLNIASNEIRLVLRDSENGLPIIGARIEITGYEGELRTDAKGELFLPAKAGVNKTKLKIHAEGYVTQQLELAEGLNNDLNLFLDKPDRKLKGQLCNDAGLNKGYFSPVTQPELKGVLKLAGKTETGLNPFTEVPATKNK